MRTLRKVTRSNLCIIRFPGKSTGPRRKDAVFLQLLGLLGRLASHGITPRGGAPTNGMSTPSSTKSAKSIRRKLKGRISTSGHTAQTSRPSPHVLFQKRTTNKIRDE